MKFESQPQFESQPSKERSPEYAKTLAELEQILKLPEDDQQKFIEKRVAALAENAKSGEISNYGRGIHKGFLGPEMKFKRNIIVDPFIMDDSSLYSDFFEMISEFKGADGWKERSLREIIPNAIQYSLSKYFGNIAAGQNTEMENREFYLDHTSADSTSISIKELKGKGFAVCAEKAAAAQNLLSFVGMESELILSIDCHLPAAAKEEAHAFILIHGPKGDMIYDPTNPKLITDKDERLVGYSQAFYPITEEQSQRLISGESITVEHTDDKIDESGQRTPEKSNRIYSGPKQIHYL